jgi:hypothetical protein
MKLKFFASLFLNHFQKKLNKTKKEKNLKKKNLNFLMITLLVTASFIHKENQGKLLLLDLYYSVFHTRFRREEIKIYYTNIQYPSFKTFERSLFAIVRDRS